MSIRCFVFLLTSKFLILATLIQNKLRWLQVHACKYFSHWTKINEIQYGDDYFTKLTEEIFLCVCVCVWGGGGGGGMQSRIQTE